MEEQIVTKAIYAITEYRRNGEKKNRWTRVGTAFANRDAMRRLALCGARARAGFFLCVKRLAYCA